MAEHCNETPFFFGKFLKVSVVYVSKFGVINSELSILFSHQYFWEQYHAKFETLFMVRIILMGFLFA